MDEENNEYTAETPSDTEDMRVRAYTGGILLQTDRTPIAWSSGFLFFRSDGRFSLHYIMSLA